MFVDTFLKLSGLEGLMGFFVKFSRASGEYFHIIWDFVNVHSRILKKIINLPIRIKGGYVRCVKDPAYGTF